MSRVVFAFAFLLVGVGVAAEPTQNGFHLRYQVIGFPETINGETSDRIIENSFLYYLRHTQKLVVHDIKNTKFSENLRIEWRSLGRHRITATHSRPGEFNNLKIVVNSDLDWTPRALEQDMIQAIGRVIGVTYSTDSQKHIKNAIQIYGKAIPAPARLPIPGKPFKSKF